MNFLTIVNQTRQHMMRRCKTYASLALWKLGCKQWAKHAPFYQLPDALMHWNQQRIARHGNAATLNAQDIAALRQLLTQAQQQSSASLPAALLDQWFFLAVGAIQRDTHTDAKRAWQLLEQSVHRQLGNATSQHCVAFGGLLSVCVLCMSLSTQPHKPATENRSPFEAAISQSGSATADPVTLRLLNQVYLNMQSGHCQLPQAAMLPEAQRQAFIMFVTAGKVDVNQVAHLKQALDYVSCLYPQALMGPQRRGS